MPCFACLICIITYIRWCCCRVFQDVLTSLSIPHAELEKLAASELSDAALTAWALTKTAAHPAVQQAAAASQRLQALLAKLDGAMMWQQQAAGSPLGQLLWQVAVGAAGSEVASLSAEQLQGRLEYQVVAALARWVGRAWGRAGCNGVGAGCHENVAAL